jgi:GTPase SAR1 family protein
MNKKILLLGVPGVGKTTTAYRMIQKFQAQNKKVALVNLDLYSLLNKLYQILVVKILFSKVFLWKLPDFYGKYNFKSELNQYKYHRLLQVTKKLIPLRYLVLILAMILSYIKQKILCMQYDVLIEHEGHILKSLGTFYFILYLCDVRGFNISFALRISFTILKNWELLYFPFINYEILSRRYKQRKSPIEPYDYLFILDSFYKIMIKYLRKV